MRQESSAIKSCMSILDFIVSIARVDGTFPFVENIGRARHVFNHTTVNKFAICLIGVPVI